jgi:uncharacterized protein
MDSQLKQQLVTIANERQVKGDPSHDFSHVLRVLAMAEKIAVAEGADLEVVIPAALFHDTVVYPKNSPQSLNETEESAVAAGELLAIVGGYPKEKISLVQACIRECSFTKGLTPSSKESAVLQDADLLESTGAIAILRTFTSGGQMQRSLFHPSDPFAKERIVTSPLSNSLDLFYLRLLKVNDRMHSATARSIAERRKIFLETFLEELRIELAESGVITGTTSV